jgi:hypothetical protein
MLGIESANCQKKGHWALLKTRFRNSLSSLNENRERNLLGLQRTANGRTEKRYFMIWPSPCLLRTLRMRRRSTLRL